MEKMMNFPLRAAPQMDDSEPNVARKYYGALELGDRMFPGSVWVDDEFESSELVDILHVGGPFNRSHIPGWHPKGISFYARHSLKWLVDEIAELSCSYGQSIGRTILTIVLTMLFFGLFYLIANATTGGTAIVRVENSAEPLTIIDYMIFTFGALANSIPQRFHVVSSLVEVMMSLQTLIGIILTGLLGFILGNRINRST